MPGVTYGGKWSSRNSRGSDFGSYSSRNMSPQRKHDTKGSSVSQYSNGYNSDRNSEVRDDYPTYLLEHLATFSVGTQYGIQNPKDGLRRLLQMEKSSGIWTQKMQMRLEKKWIIIIDNENGDIVERFPMNLIADPTSYTSNDPRELYNNVIVFIVKDDPKNKNHNPPEMHIFQCARVSAQEVVNEMKMFINGKWKPGHRERYIPPPPTNPPPEPPVNGVNVKEQVNLFNAVAAAAASPPREDRMIQRVSSSGYHKIDRMDNGSDRNASYSRDSNDETSSTSSEKYERDVAILNHCFDDIERFIARLQHAAAAFKELERRQKSRKNKKKDMGDGMLSMRAKPPSEREFVDVLQKFKLSFNLLAKLKNHIHDPNAPELVHFLFTPLALIVDAAKDSNYSTELASRVSAPLLTRDACELLMNCCTSKESDLLHSLGEAWIVPRDQWKSFEGAYHPVFSDGWAPENPFSEKRERAEATAVAAAAMAQKYHRDDVRRSQEESEMRHAEYRVPSRQDRESRYGSEFHYSERGERPLSPLHAHEPPHPSFENRFYDQNLETPGRDVFERNGAVTPVSDHDFADHRDRDMRSDFSADSIDHVNPLDPNRQFETQQKQWLEDMKSRGARIVQVMYPRTANNDKELTVVRGELLEVIDDSRKWWKARNARGQVAHVPHTIVGPVSSVDEDSFNNPIYGSRGNGSGTKEPYYTPSDSPVGRERLAENGHRDPPSGMPKGHVPLPAPAPADWIRRERQGKKDKHAYEEIEATLAIDDMCESPTDKPLRHKHPLKAETSFTEKSKTLPRSVNVMDTLHDELKMRFTLGPKSGKKCNIIDRQSLPITHLTPMSSAYDVQLWLNAKGFSARAQQKLQNVKGESMFLLSKSEIEEDLGPEEGSKLYNQLMIQKNICGYNMRSSKELSAILEARRKRIDSDDSSEDATGGKYYEGNTAKPEIKKTEMKKAEIPKKERKQTEGKTNEMKKAEIPKKERKQTEGKTNEMKKAEIPKKERKQEEERNNEMKMAEIPKIERKQSELKNNEMRKAEIQKIERKQTEVKNNEMKTAEMPKMDRKQTDVKKIEENKTPVGVWF